MKYRVLKVQMLLASREHDPSSPHFDGRVLEGAALLDLQVSI